MPQRFLRPGLTTSERFNSVPWHAQSFYVRLLTLVDDFGRYDANPRLLISHAFPLGDHEGKAVALTTLDNICKQLSTNSLAEFYVASDGKKYLQVVRWQERARAEKSKYPPFDNTCEQMFTNDSKCSLPSSSPSSSPLSHSSNDSQESLSRQTSKAKGSEEEITSFCTSHNILKSDAEWFYNKCVGNGWRNGGKPILDWKATLRSWKSAGYLPSQKQNNNGAKHLDPPGTFRDVNNKLCKSQA